jgi:hypothetical protein
MQHAVTHHHRASGCYGAGASEHALRGFRFARPGKCQPVLSCRSLLQHTKRAAGAAAAHTAPTTITTTKCRLCSRTTLIEGSQGAAQQQQQQPEAAATACMPYGLPELRRLPNEVHGTKCNTGG